MRADGEFALIARIAPHLTGAGDDAAMIVVGDTRVLLAADAVVEGRHFRLDVSSPADAGWKALAVNLSDLAAMGAVRPRAALITLLRPPGCDTGVVEGLYEGLAEAARTYGVDLVGGDTTAAAELALSVAVIGEPLGEPVWRSGARPGDHVVVVGGLGAAAAALEQARQGTAADVADTELLRAHQRPVPLLAAGRVLAEHGAMAMIDVSDGFGQDLGHLCRASGVAARVHWSALPVAAGVPEAMAGAGADLVALVCGGGEDYALIAAVPAGRAEAAAAAASRAQGVPAAVVGELRALPGEQGQGEGRDQDPGPATGPGQGREPIVELVSPDGSVRDIATLGWDHFRPQEFRLQEDS